MLHIPSNPVTTTAEKKIIEIIDQNLKEFLLLSDISLGNKPASPKLLLKLNKLQNSK